MSKICNKCNKTVYPLEELKCLDKIWHKTCFKCWECGMSLNMKNYKGFDKKPYCSAHYPHMKATVVAETPELQRIAQNTKLQSQIKYHEDFEKNIKGSKIQVSDDPELQRVKQVNHMVSQVEYKNKNKTSDKLDERRTSLTSSVTSAGAGERWMPGPTSSASRDVVKPSPYSERAISHSTTYTAEGKVEGVPRLSRIGSIADYDPVNENYGSLASGYRPSSVTTRVSQSQEWEEVVPMSPQTKSGRSSASSAVSTSGIGSSSDADQHNTSAAATHQPDDVFPSKDSEPASGTANDTLSDTHSDTHSETTAREVVVEEETQQHKQQDDQLDISSTPIQQEEEEQQPESTISQQPEPTISQQSEPTVSEDSAEPNTEESDEPGTSLGAATFLTMYDYDAQDEDEVSFVENDKVVNVRSVSDGWMFGTVERTGRRGMFPANYVEEIK